MIERDLSHSGTSDEGLARFLVKLIRLRLDDLGPRDRNINLKMDRSSAFTIANALDRLLDEMEPKVTRRSVVESVLADHGISLTQLDMTGETNDE